MRPDRSGTPFPRLVGYFRRHPVLLLLLLTPGIPEYLSGSTAVWPWVSSLGGLLIGLLSLGLNLGLYGPGVLLVREAHVRWKKGWSTVVLLGAAYGLLEEGTALSTLFDPTARVVGPLGTYGHALGVNWLWVIGVLEVHIVLSIGLPILLLGLALPETRGRSLVVGRPVPVVLGVFAVDLLLLNLLVHYPAGVGLQFAALAVALLLALVAWRLPAGRLDPSSPTPRRRPAVFLGYGFAFVVVALVATGLGRDFRLPAPVTGVLALIAGIALFLAVRRDVGARSNEPHLILLAVGTIAPIALLGFLSEWFLPVVLLLDLVAGLFFYTLWAHYRPRVMPTVPGGALLGPAA